jgi:hypothetical protein
MHIRLVERANRLQFNQDAIANQQVGHIIANDDTVIMNSDRLLLQDRQTSLAQFMGQAIFTNRLRGTGTQPVPNPECAADNDPRNPIHPRNIGVHLRPSAAKIPYLRQFAHTPLSDRENVQ